MRNSPAIILVRPQMGENIGAVARAMSNFGLSDLRLVAPRDGWPNEKALEMAASAKGIIERASLHDCVADSLAGIDMAYATTARTRKMEKPVLTARECATACHDTSGRIAFMFGAERSGLENDELVLADALVTIPTAENASLNLAQACIVLGYEWHCQNEGSLPTPPTHTVDKPGLAGLLNQLETYLDEANYFRTPDLKPSMWLNLQNIFTRARLNEQEVRSLRGMFRSLFEK